MTELATPLYIGKRKEPTVTAGFLPEQSGWMVGPLTEGRTDLEKIFLRGWW